MKHKIIMILCLVLMICLCACAKEDENVTGKVEDNPLSEKEIIGYVQNYMKDKFGDDTEVKVVGKYDLTYRTYAPPGLDGAPSLFNNKYAKIKDGHRYNLKITNPVYDLTVAGTYYDGFTLQYLDTGTTEAIERKLEVDYYYSYKKKEIDMLKEFEALLYSKFRKYHLYKDSSYTSPWNDTACYNLYIYSTDYDVINDALHELMKIADARFEGYTCIVRAYVFKDEAFYDSFDFEKYNNINYNNIYNSVKGDNEKLSELEKEYLPKLFLEHYLGQKITYITECINLERNTFMTEGYKDVIIIFEGRLAEYRSSLHITDADIHYGNTKVYACTR